MENAYLLLPSKHCRGDLEIEAISYVNVCTGQLEIKAVDGCGRNFEQ
jgi:hypothetical protein